MAEDIQAKIAEFDERLRLLDRKFSLYLSGHEKVSPARELEELKRELTRFKRTQNRLAGFGQRFMAEGFQQRFNAYRSKWERQLRDIETGRAAVGSGIKAQT